MVLVGIVIVGLLGAAVFQFLGFLGAPTAEVVADFEETDAGVVMAIEAIGQEADVKINGETVATIDGGDAGREVFLPTAPGDRITVVATDDDRSVLVSEEIDEGDAGDFIAYYDFETQSGSTAVDRTGNGNNMSVVGADWVSDSSGTGLEFDGNDDYGDTGNLSLPGVDEVDAITIAIEYRITGGDGNIQNLIEHQDSSFAWYMETDGPHGDPYDMEFDIGFTSPPTASINTGNLPADRTEILVGTYDGETMTLYRNGTKVDSRSLDRSVELGEVVVGADSNPAIQNMEGKIYEVRIYYTAFDEDEVETLTEAVD